MMHGTMNDETILAYPGECPNRKPVLKRPRPSSNKYQLITFPPHFTLQNVNERTQQAGQNHNIKMGKKFF